MTLLPFGGGRTVRIRKAVAALAGVIGAAAVVLAVLLLTLPEPLPVESGWPATTAYMELRREQARAEGRSADIAWEPVPLATIPRSVRRAVIVAEDAAFWRHGGVDWSQVRTAVREWWSGDERLRGASTLTMQLARNLYLSPDRSWLRKARETLLAWRLEDRLSKHRILELYLSVVELGPGVFGVEAAARHYWGVPVSALGPRRAAELAAALPSPLDDNPATRSPAFLWRADLVFGRTFGEDRKTGTGGGRPVPTVPDTARPPLPSPEPNVRDTAAGRADGAEGGGPSETDSAARTGRSAP